MFPKLNTPETQSFNLRQPYSARRGNGFQDAHFDRPQPVFGHPPGQLDMSIHHPRTPSCNRFAPLTRPEASAQWDREVYPSRPHRRSRNSRGTKEAKKRRDSRRNKRKSAVHLLNEQLSHDIEKTLSQFEIFPWLLTDLRPAASAVPTTSASRHTDDDGSRHVAPSAPTLPPVTFHGFSLPDFPPLIVPRASPPPSPFPMLAGVPTWCPPIPSLTSGRVGSGELPNFYDLSSLQEPKSSPLATEKYHSLQLWGGNLPTLPRKQSRFFPPRTTSPKPKVRLPPNGPMGQTPGAGLHDPSNEDYKVSDASAKQDSITQAIERILAAARAVETKGKEPNLPSAANLWNILEQAPQQLDENPNELRVCWKDQEADVEESSVPLNDEQSGPFELACSDVPYVHTNSLTGYANETAAHHFESNVLGDSAIYLADMFAPGEDVTFNREPYSMQRTHPSCTSAAGPPVSSFTSSCTSTEQITEQIINVVIDTRAEVTEGVPVDTAAQFKSEQSLFAVSAPTEQTGPSPSESVCDLATFLSMGHVEHCWCLTCGEEPELVSEATVMDSEESLVENDGWMTWCGGLDLDSAMSVEEDTDARSTLIEGQTTGLRLRARSENGDELFLRTPRRARALIKSEPNIKLLGYLDDGAASAHADDDEDDEWEWDF